MAEAAVASILGKLAVLAGGYIQGPLGVAWGLKKQLSKLETRLLQFQSMLADAERRRDEEAVHRWLDELKDVVYEAESVLDQIEYEILRHQVHRGVVHKVRNFFNQNLNRLKIGWKLHNIQDTINELVSVGKTFRLIPSADPLQPESVDRETCSFVKESNVVGRLEVKNHIVDVLIGDQYNNHNNINKKVTVLSIVGMGGIGKTTLARLIYNDPQVKEHFKDFCEWVCVSDIWDIKKIIKSIIKKELKKEQVTNIGDHLEELCLALEKALTNKRYLIVLDDIWNEDKTKWDNLKDKLDCGGEGSVILVTTRSERASMIMGGPLQTYRLPLLSEDESWALFSSKAFATGAEMRKELVDIGKEITKRCGGLPLALQMIGSLLYEKSDRWEWLRINESAIWNMDTEILPALRLSYKHLPLCSKRCFTFCAIFPKDYLMRKDELINMWMAHGFISSDGSLEDNGHEIFNQLVQRSFLHLLDEVENNFDMVTTCRMHDLIHDLAQSIVGQNEYVTQLEKSPEGAALKKVYHLSISGSKPNNEFSVEHLLKASPNLRTLFILSDNLIEEDMDFSQSSFLRVLRLQGLNCTGLSNSLKTQHLRYLNLSLTSVSCLPESICTMLQLQILDLSYCRCLKELPKRMRHLISLRHLYLRGCDELKGMPAGMGRLTNLRTLTNYILAPGDNNAGNGIGQLNGLQLLLPYQLVLRGLNYVKKSVKVNRYSKVNLSRLKVEWGRGFDGRELLSEKEKENEEKVLNELRPPRGIESLKIVDYSVLNLPQWIADSDKLPRLVELHLVRCLNLHHLPPIWKLKSLQVLNLVRNDELKFIISDWNNERDTSCQAFPSLKKLNLRHLKSLQGWCENNAKLTMPLQLESLTIIACDTLTTMPNCPAPLKYLCIGGCPELVALETAEEQISHLTSLEDLLICDCPSLNYSISGMEGLTALHSLNIDSCNQLMSLPEGLTALHSLNIDSCNQLMSLPEGLTALHSLNIDSCNQLMSLPEGLTALHSLQIWYCDQLMSLPEGLASLRSLEIRSCKQLKSLPKDLTALRSLEIWSCHQLMSLPEDLLQRLSTITIAGRLRIEDCPELEKKYGHLLKEETELE